MVLYKPLRPLFMVKYCYKGVIMLKFQDLNCKISAQYQGSFSFVPHIHKAIEIILLTKGKLKVDINNESYILTEGEASVAFPYQVHAYEDIDNLTEGYLLFIEPSEISDFKDELATLSPIRPIVTSRDSILPSLCEEILTLSGSESNIDSNILKGLASTFIGYAIKNMSFKKQELSDLNTVQKLLIFCDKNYKSGPTLDIAAKEIGISKYYISHLFNEKIGVGFNTYINMLKINEAAFLLDSTYKSITEIALEVGYTSIRSFNREFKEKTGLTPSEFRKQKKNIAT